MTDAGNPDSDLVIRGASAGPRPASSQVVNRLVVENENPQEFAAPDSPGARGSDRGENRCG